jgi:glycosyltransferase involved in cell wall biosynthesis
MSLFACHRAHCCLATYYLTPFPVYWSWWLHGKHAHIIYLAQHHESISHVMMSRKKTGWQKKVLYQLAKRSYYLPFEIITVSSWIKEQIGRDDIAVIPNGIDLDTFYPTNNRPSKPMVGAIGRQNPIKGLEIFLAAANLLPDDIEIHVLSDQTLELPPFIQHIKPMHDRSIREFYQSCTVFVFTSSIEGFGLPPLEAMACGTPVITTDCGGVREYANEQNCILVPPGKPEAIADAVNRLLADERLQKQLRAAGIETAQRFSLQQVAHQYQRYFDRFR